MLIEQYRSIVLSIHENNFKQIITSGIAELNLDASQTKIDQTLDYLSLLQKWNQSFNLVSSRNKLEIVERHILDSLSVNEYIGGECILDMGSGAGLPGIPLAIFNPEKKFILLDSNGKKTRFLQQVKTALHLQSIEIENSRVENYQTKHQIDMVVCRAFSSLAEIAKKAQHLLSRDCKILAMKGKFPEDEISELSEEVKVSNIVELKVPGISSERHLVELSIG